MPNLCSVCYKCVADKNQIRELNAALKYLDKRKTPLEKNGWGKLWLGCLIKKLGGNWEEYDCRGVILSYGQCDDGSYMIDQDTAWTEQEEFRRFLEKRFPGMKVYYLEQEPGCENFYCNDVAGVYFPERFFLDSEEDQFYFHTIEEAAAKVSLIVGHEVNAVEDEVYDTITDYADSHEDVFYSFHSFLVIDD